MDNIELAEFIFLLLKDPKLPEVIDMIRSNAVLTLGSFTAKRKSLLDGLRQELRKRDRVPVGEDALRERLIDSLIEPRE